MARHDLPARRHDPALPSSTSPRPTSTTCTHASTAPAGRTNCRASAGSTASRATISTELVAVLAAHVRLAGGRGAAQRVAPVHDRRSTGTNVHFAHIRSPEPDATPLIITHGWPGSIVEFLDVVGPLTDPRAHGGDPADAFHVVLPSIPGFGLSGPTRDTGWELSAGRRRVRRADGPARLRRYGAQGGDWGAGISRELGRARPDRVIGVHLNLLPRRATRAPSRPPRSWPR